MKKPKKKNLPYSVFWYKKGEYGVNRVERMILRKNKRHEKRKEQQKLNRETERSLEEDWLDDW